MSAPQVPTIPEDGSRATRVARAVWDWRAGHDADADRSRHAKIALARREALRRAAIGVLIAAALFWWKPAWGAVALVLSATVIAVAWVSPLRGYRRLSAGFAGLGRLVGAVVGWILMAMSFYLLIVPLGLVLRALGRLRLTSAADPRRASYWEPVDWRRVTPPTYRRQF